MMKASDSSDEIHRHAEAAYVRCASQKCSPTSQNLASMKVINSAHERHLQLSSPQHNMHMKAVVCIPMPIHKHAYIWEGHGTTNHLRIFVLVVSLEQLQPSNMGGKDCPH